MTGRYKDREFTCLGCGVTDFGSHRPGKRYCTSACYHHAQLGVTRPREWGVKIGTSLKAHGKGASPTKTCPRCKIEKPRTGFGVRANGHTESYCLDCARAKSRISTMKYIERTPRKKADRKATNRATTLRRYYGITVDEYEAMKRAQRGVCAICKQPPRGKGNQSKLHVDHCHETGLIRGLLCAPCNHMIGYARDNQDILAGGVAYLNLIGGVHGARYVKPGCVKGGKAREKTVPPPEVEDVYEAS